MWYTQKAKVRFEFLFFLGLLFWTVLGTILESLSVHIVSDIVWNIVFFWFLVLGPETVFCFFSWWSWSLWPLWAFFKCLWPYGLLRMPSCMVCWDYKLAYKSLILDWAGTNEAILVLIKILIKVLWRASDHFRLIFFPKYWSRVILVVSLIPEHLTV